MFTLLIIIYQRENQRHVFVFATTTEINSWHCCIIYRLCPQTDYVIGDKMMHICTDAILLSTLHVQPWFLLLSWSPGCRGRCGLEYSRGSMCQCDYNCLTYDECCKDYESQCTTSETFLSKNVTLLNILCNWLQIFVKKNKKTINNTIFLVSEWHLLNAKGHIYTVQRCYWI